MSEKRDPTARLGADRNSNTGRKRAAIVLERAQPVSCCKKFCAPEEYMPQFKLFISFNHKPVMKGADDGIKSRIKMIPFMVKIPVNERDTKLSGKLQREAEGILNWMLEGCKMWQEGGLKEPQKVHDATETYFDEMDLIGEFLETCCVVGPENFISFDPLYSFYIMWCKYKHCYPQSSKAFSQSFNEKNLMSGKNKGVRGKWGVKLNERLTSVQSKIDGGEDCVDRWTDVDRCFLFKDYMEDATCIADINQSNLSNLSTTSFESASSDNVKDVNTLDLLPVQSVQSVLSNISKEYIETHIENRYKSVDKSSNPDGLHTLIVEEVINELDIGKYGDSYEVVEGIVTEYLNPPEASHRDFVCNVREYIRSHQNATQNGAELATVLSGVEGSESRIMYAINQLKSQGEIMELGTECYKVV